MHFSWARSDAREKVNVGEWKSNWPQQIGVNWRRYFPDYRACLHRSCNFLLLARKATTLMEFYLLFAWALATPIRTERRFSVSIEVLLLLRHLSLNALRSILVYFAFCWLNIEAEQISNNSGGDGRVSIETIREGWVACCLLIDAKMYFEALQ